MAGQLIDWAGAHGFTPSERSFAGETPLLRLGTADISGVTFDGQVDGHRALLGEFFIASRTASASVTRVSARPIS